MKTSDSRAFVNQVMVYALVALCSTGTLGLGTVWMRHQISVVANSDRVLKARIDDVDRRMQEVVASVAAEEDPAVLAHRNEQWGIGLVPPSDGQIVLVRQDPVLRLASIENRRVFDVERPLIQLRGDMESPRSDTRAGNGEVKAGRSPLARDRGPRDGARKAGTPPLVTFSVASAR